MFSSPAYLAKRTGPHGIGRFSFLQSLVTEFQDTDSEDAKLQVLANLANFSYDPINYDYLYQLNVIDLFLDCLSESCDQTVEYSVGGLCNLCLDKRNKEYILKNDGVKLLCKCLSSSVEETVISTIITLMFLVTPDSKTEITSLPVVDAMIRFSRYEGGLLYSFISVSIDIAPCILISIQNPLIHFHSQCLTKQFFKVLLLFITSLYLNICI